jgi:hypothetical protein
MIPVIFIELINIILNLLSFLLEFKNNLIFSNYYSL